MKFGLHLDNAYSSDPNQLLSEWQEMVALADANGFAYVSVVDHLVPFPSFRPMDLPQFDAWQLLASFAASSQKVSLLTLVTNGSLRHPVPLAKQFSSLDRLSQGRAVLGLGAGGYELDDAALGITERRQQERYERLEECMAVLRLLWRGQASTFEGRHYKLDDIVSQPVPSSAPKILIAGKSASILRLAAEHADAINFAFASLLDLEDLLDKLKSQLALQDKTIQNFEVTLLDRIFIGSSVAEAESAWSAAGGPTVNGHRGLIGSSSKIVSDIEALEASGANSLFCMFQNLESLEAFITDVIPYFASR